MAWQKRHGAMAIKPILFSTEMVQAILDGRKTQTRRVVKGEFLNAIERWVDGSKDKWYGYTGPTLSFKTHCPYGAKGYDLWVRETWAVSPFLNKVKPSELEGCIKGDNPKVIYKASNGYSNANDYTWRPSIFMPRWASRIILKVHSIRVERIQDITYDDCNNEGIPWGPVPWKSGPKVYKEFKELWNSINAKRGYPWADNPWVWVIDFELVTGDGNDAHRLHDN